MILIPRVISNHLSPTVPQPYNSIPFLPLTSMVMEIANSPIALLSPIVKRASLLILFLPPQNTLQLSLSLPQFPSPLPFSTIFPTLFLPSSPIYQYSQRKIEPTVPFCVLNLIKLISSDLNTNQSNFLNSSYSSNPFLLLKLSILHAYLFCYNSRASKHSIYQDSI